MCYFNNRLIVLFVVTMYLLSCSRGNINIAGEENLINEKKLGAEIINVRINGDEAALYSDFFTDIKYVELETSPESVISRVTKLQIANNGDYIIFDRVSGAVLRFNSKGNFLNHIGYRGSGANEYIRPTQIEYDPYHNQVIIYDNGKKRFMLYNMEGELQNTISTPWIAATFGLVDANHLIVFMNNDEDLTKKFKGYNYKILDFDGNIIKEFGEFGKESLGFSPACENTFHRQNGKLLCNPPYSSLITEINIDSISSRFYISFGNDRIPKEWLKGSHRDLDDKIHKYENIVFGTDFFEDKDYIIMNLVRNSIVSLCIQSKKDTNEKYIGFVTINDIFGLVSSTDVKEVHNGKVYMCIEREEFERKKHTIEYYPENINIADKMSEDIKNTPMTLIMKAFGKKNPLNNIANKLKDCKIVITNNDKQLINHLSEDGNPVIQVCTLKR